MDTEQTLTFPDLMKERANQKRKSYDDAHYKLVSDYVTLVKRNRGDYMGVMRQNRRNFWNPVLSKGLVTYPVIPRALRAKTATAMSTDIQLEIDSILKLPEKQAAAEIATGIYKFAEEHYWTENLEARIALLGQIGRFSAVLIEQEEGLTVGKRAITAKKWVQAKDTSIACIKCGATYIPDDYKLSPKGSEQPEETETPADEQDEEENNPYPDGSKEHEAMESPEEEQEEQAMGDDDSAQGEEPEEQGEPKPSAPQYDLKGLQCQNPQCGAMDSLSVAEDGDFEEQTHETGSTAVKMSQLKHTVIPSLLIRYDDLHTIGFDWQKAHWFNYHPIVPRYEILADYPELRDKLQTKSWQEWSEASRWYYELTKAEGNLGTSNYNQENTYSELMEKDFWFWEEVMCNGWVEPSGYELKKDGKVVFDIKAGESIRDAFERNFKEEFRGCCVEMVGDEIINIRNESFLGLFNLIGWQIDPASHVPMGEERLIPLQDAATRVLTMVYSGVQKMTNPKGIYDGKYFDKSDLLSNQPAQWIASKQDVINPEEKGGIFAHIGYLAPPNPSALVDMFINLVIQIAKEESGIFDETVGNVNNGNPTARGRELALNQSLGLMTPTQKAKKEGKVSWIKLILKLWQTFPDEAFILIKGTFEEEWKSEDIAAFKALDIDGELSIKALAGTDKPRTESDLLNNIMVAAQLGLLSPAPPFAPEVAQYICKRVLNIDIDLSNADADRRLAGRRFDVMKELCGEFAAMNPSGLQGLVAINEDPMTGFPVRGLHPDVVATIAQDPRTKVYPEDNAAVMIGYYTDVRKGIQGSKDANEIELLLCDLAIQTHTVLMTNQAAQQQMALAVANKAGADIQNGGGGMPQQGAPQDMGAGGSQQASNTSPIPVQ